MKVYLKTSVNSNTNTDLVYYRVHILWLFKSSSLKIGFSPYFSDMPSYLIKNNVYRYCLKVYFALNAAQTAMVL